MKKTINHKGKSAQIKVLLFHVTERSPNGKSYHHATITGNSYHDEKAIDTSLNLEDELSKIEKKFMDWVETPEPSKSKEEKLLEDLGYTH